MHTVSRLTDAASLLNMMQWLVSIPAGRMQQTNGVGSPAVVVVTVDVEDLLALDTKHAVTRPTDVSSTLLVGTIDSLEKLDRIYPERMHSVRPVTTPSSSAKIQ